MGDSNIVRNSSDNHLLTPKDHEKRSVHKSLDLAFLFADPLMIKDEHSKLVPMN